MNTQQSRPVLAMNMVHGHSAYAPNSKAYYSGCAGDGRIRILVRSRCGRWIERWADRADVYNARITTLYEMNPMFKDARISTEGTLLF